MALSQRPISRYGSFNSWIDLESKTARWCEGWVGNGQQPRAGWRPTKGDSRLEFTIGTHPNLPNPMIHVIRHCCRFTGTAQSQGNTGSAVFQFVQAQQVGVVPGTTDSLLLDLFGDNEGHPG